MPSPDTQQQRHQDILHYKPSILKVIDDERTLKLLADPHYYAVITVLREGPMTVRELESAYNSIVTKRIDKMPIEDKEKKEIKKKAKRKGKTLYKYLDVLLKNGLVIQAGKRVKMGQTASETLYGRTAKLFFKSDKNLAKLTAKETKKIVPIIAKIICMEKEAKEVSEACLANYILKCFLLLHDERKRVLSKYSKEITEASVDVHYDDLFLVIQILDIYFFLTHATELNKSLNDCIKK